jgi:hypothetical protein
MRQETNFIIFKGDDDRYSITECGNAGVKKAFITQSGVSGDRDVLLKLSRIVPVNESLRSFIENNSGRLICVDENLPAFKLW